MRLFVVVIEDIRRAVTDRVLLYAATRPEEAEQMARDFYRSDGRSLRRYRFSPQPITEVSSPEGTLYRIVLHPLTNSGS